jgi:hypothetical protein
VSDILDAVVRGEEEDRDQRDEGYACEGVVGGIGEVVETWDRGRIG